MADHFLHGIELVEIEEGGRTVRTVKSSVIGLVGTAPGASSARCITKVKNWHFSLSCIFHLFLN